MQKEFSEWLYLAMINYEAVNERSCLAAILEIYSTDNMKPVSTIAKLRNNSTLQLMQLQKKDRERRSGKPAVCGPINRSHTTTGDETRVISAQRQRMSLQHHSYSLCAHRQPAAAMAE